MPYFSMLSFPISRDHSHSDSKTSSNVSSLQMRIRILENNLAKSLLINEALWELIKKHHDLTEDDLNEKLYMVDMRDGQLDGKNQRTTAIECPKCHRTVSARHASCFYCGQIIDDSVFSMK